MTMMAGLTYILGLIAVSVSLYAVLSNDNPWMDANTVKTELVKIGLQVVVFGLIGGGVKLLLDRQAAYRNFRADMLERLGKAHKDVYRIRRLLNRDPNKNPELLGELMNARQDLGAAYHYARPWLLQRKLRAIQDQTEGMRAYLEDVITGAFAADDSVEHACYTDFVNWRANSPAYEREFKARYKRAKELIDPKSAVHHRTPPPA